MTSSGARWQTGHMTTTKGSLAKMIPASTHRRVSSFTVFPLPRLP